MAPLIAALIKAALPGIAGAVLAKGKEVVEAKLGVNLDEAVTTEAGRQSLREAEIRHAEFLVALALAEKKADQESEATGQGQVTERWRHDMTSDSWLSKNVRPLVLAYLTAAITMMAVAPINVEEAWIKLLENAYITVLAAYFIGRSAQHITKTRAGK
jgi:hypothetical protein